MFSHTVQQPGTLVSAGAGLEPKLEGVRVEEAAPETQNDVLEELQELAGSSHRSPGIKLGWVFPCRLQ